LKNILALTENVCENLVKIISKNQSSACVLYLTGQGWKTRKPLVYYKITKNNVTVSCRDVGMDCVCKGETDEEIMKNAEQHCSRK
jgi:hypothetical protein